MWPASKSNLLNAQMFAYILPLVPNTSPANHASSRCVWHHVSTTLHFEIILRCVFKTCYIAFQPTRQDSPGIHELATYFIPHGWIQKSMTGLMTGCASFSSQFSRSILFSAADINGDGRLDSEEFADILADPMDTGLKLCTAAICCDALMT